MTEKQIRRIGKLAFSQCIHPIKKARSATKTLIVGFDTEYDSETKELLTLQFWHRECGEVYEIPPGFVLTRAKLEHYLYDFLQRVCKQSIQKRHVRAIKLISFFSLAETQHIADIHEAQAFETQLGVDFVWTTERGDRSIEIVDVAKFFPGMALAKVAEAFGLRKLSWRRDKVSRADLRKPGFIEYAKHDAYLCYVVYTRLRGGYLSLGADIILTKTAASTALTIYRVGYLRVDCTQPNIRLRRLALRANWGGRNEAFARGIFEGTIYEYDATSEYPNSAIQLGTMPIADSWREAYSVDVYRSANGIARVAFRFPPSVHYPCLPVFSIGENGNGKLYYPTAGVSDCTGAEIRLAMQLGAELELYEGYYYETGTDSLAHFMRDMIRKKDEAEASGDSVMRTVYKLNMNSVIGKFIQRVDKIDINNLLLLARKEGVDVAFLRTYSDASIAEACKEHGLGELRKVSLGAGFYPEWNTLILGYARAATSAAINYFAQLGYRPLLSSTDSVIFHVPDGAPDPPKHVQIAGIDFRRDKSAQRIEVIRTRLYRMRNHVADGPATRLEDKGEYVHRNWHTVKAAHHAIPRGRQAAEAFDFWCENPDAARYDFQNRRLRKYRESVTRGAEYGADVYEDRSVGFAFDCKRLLLADGTTRPLASLDHLAQFNARAAELAETSSEQGGD